MVNITLTDALPLVFFALFFGITIAPFIRRRKPTITCNRKHALLFSCIIAGLLFISFSQQLRNWQLFETFTKSDIQEERVAALGHLLKVEEFLPPVISVSTNRLIQDKRLHPQFAGMLPYTEKAIQHQQRRLLYQALFLGYMYRGNREQACKTGLFILKQRWKTERNAKIYHDVCNGKTITTDYLP